MADAKSEKEAQAQQAEVEAPSLIEQILDQTKMKPSDFGYDVARKGVEAFITELLKPAHAQERVERRLVDEMIAEIDRKLSAQLDEILHHKDFQKLESAWRGLKFLVDRTDFRENIKLELLNVSKEDLLADFEDAPEITKSGLYKTVYSAEYGQFGGKPVRRHDRQLRLRPRPAGHRAAAEVRRRSRPWRTRPSSPPPARSSSAGGSSSTLPNLKDLKSLFEGPQYTKWHSFRETEDARYVGLTAAALPAAPALRRETPSRSRRSTTRRTSSASTTQYLLGQRRLRVRHAPRRQLRQVPLVPEHHRPAGGRRGRGPAAAPVRGDGRDPDQDPDRGPAHRAPRVRAVARRASSA